MPDKSDDHEFLSDTLSRAPIGSAESRAAIRAILERAAPPTFAVSFVGTELGPDQTIIAKPCDSAHAEARGGSLREAKHFTRLESESLDQFELRVRRSLPIAPPMTIIFWPKETTA
jgi:hypothetical protein